MTGTQATPSCAPPRGRQRRRPHRHPPGQHRRLLLPLPADGDGPHQPAQHREARCGASASRPPAATPTRSSSTTPSGELVTHHVDDRFVTNASGAPQYAQYGDQAADGGQELWVMLMEKAWAAQRGGFNQLDFGQASDGLMAVSGKRGTWHKIADETADQIITNIAQAYQDGKPVVSNTPRPDHRPRSRVVDRGRHPAGPEPRVQRRAGQPGRRRDRRREPARPQPPARHRRSGTFRMIFEWYLASPTRRCG